MKFSIQQIGWLTDAEDELEAEVDDRLDDGSDEILLDVENELRSDELVVDDQDEEDDGVVSRSDDCRSQRWSARCFTQPYRSLTDELDEAMAALMLELLEDELQLLEDSPYPQALAITVALLVTLKVWRSEYGTTSPQSRSFTGSMLV